MTGHDLENRLRAAQRAEGEQADPGALLERVLSIPETVEPRRRRWWHGFRIGSLRGAGGNGGTTKGGPLMFSATRVAAAVAVLALTGAFAMSGMFGPDPEPLAPAGETPAQVDWVNVTGTETHQCSGGVCSARDEMSDPRVSGGGSVTYEYQIESEALSTNYTQWGDYSLANEGGFWDGEWIGFIDQNGDHRITSLLRGSGDHEGLSYVVSGDEQPDGELRSIGLIYSGDIPHTVVMGAEPEATS